MEDSRNVREKKWSNLESKSMLEWGDPNVDILVFYKDGSIEVGA